MDPQFISHRRAFTLIELMISLAIMVILASVSFAFFLGAKNKATLLDASQPIVQLARQAQSRAVSGVNNAAWGIHFDRGANGHTTNSSTSFYALFYGSYSTSTVVARYSLPSDVYFCTGITGFPTSTEWLFSSISGGYIGDPTWEYIPLCSSTDLTHTVTIDALPSGQITVQIATSS